MEGLHQGLAAVNLLHFNSSNVVLAAGNTLHLNSSNLVLAAVNLLRLNSSNVVLAVVNLLHLNSSNLALAVVNLLHLNSSNLGQAAVNSLHVNSPKLTKVKTAIRVGREDPVSLGTTLMQELSTWKVIGRRRSGVAGIYIRIPLRTSAETSAAA